MEDIRVLIPSTMIMMAPASVIYRRSRSAFVKSQPVTPLISIRGDMAVPRPNKVANVMLSMGFANGME